MWWDFNPIASNIVYHTLVASQDQVWEPVLTEIGLDVLNVGNMIIFPKIVQTHKQKDSQNKSYKCII